MTKILLPIFLLLLAWRAPALTYYTATVAITNSSGTTNGQTITCNGDTRTWTNAPVLPASQILTNNTPNGAAANLFNQVIDFPFSSVVPGQTATTNVTLTSTNIITVTVSAGWATVTYSPTNPSGGNISVTVGDSYTPAQKTNVYSGIARMISDPANTNGLGGAAVAAFARLDGTNVFTGTNTFTKKTVFSNEVLIASSGPNLLGASNTVERADATNSFLFQGADGNIVGSKDGSTLTNLPLVSSCEIQANDIFTNNVGDGGSLSQASSIIATNYGPVWAFADAITNCARFRWLPPSDWNAGTLAVGLGAICTGTNAAVGGPTNVVFAVRCGAIGDGDRIDAPTFGTAQWITNHIGTSAYTRRLAVTSALTVGNSPSASKGILFEIQRLGAQAGDTLTNADLCLTEVWIYHRRNSVTNFPAYTP